MNRKGWWMVCLSLFFQTDIACGETFLQLQKDRIQKNQPLILLAESETTTPLPLQMSEANLKKTTVEKSPLILLGSYQKAQIFDPLYRAALAERDASLIASKVAGMAFYPQLKLSTTQYESENGQMRWTATISQPIINAERFASWREEEPRVLITGLNLKIKQNELAKRIYKIFSELTMAREGLSQNKKRIEALEEQWQAGKRALQLGQGTITDLRDAEVKVLQAKADNLRLNADLQAAEQEYESIIGIRTPQFKLKRQGGSHLVDHIETEGPALNIDNNPELLLARLSERLGELSAIRAKSAWIPELNAAYTMTKKGNSSDSYMGFVLSMPVNAGGILGLYSADANLTKLREESQDKERRIRLNMDHLVNVVHTGGAEVDMRLAAIEAAELSVDANKKSYKGGVRTLLDVLGSIEVLYSVKNEFIRSLLNLGDNVINLHLLRGGDVESGLEMVENMLLDTEIH
ncbi:MAG: TolC family protein [Magnetococcus sp. DMHC-6]